MSMTTLLTLSSMFNALTTITPPISYTTKLDIWMVCCIFFIFGTLLEFTVVIFLKYYLRHLPLNFAHSRAETPEQKGLFDVKTQIHNWLKVRNFHLYRASHKLNVILFIDFLIIFSSVNCLFCDSY